MTQISQVCQQSATKSCCILFHTLHTLSQNSRTATYGIKSENCNMQHNVRSVAPCFEHAPPPPPPTSHPTDDRDDLTKVGNPKLLDILEQAGQLQAQVSRPREQALDSELFHNLAECGREMAKRLVNGTQSVSASDFVRRLQHVFSRNDDVCFQSLAVEHHQVLPVVSGICCMLGPLESCPQARKERAAPQRTRRAPPAPVVVPTQQLVGWDVC